MSKANRINVFGGRTYLEKRALSLINFIKVNIVKTLLV